MAPPTLQPAPPPADGSGGLGAPPQTEAPPDRAFWDQLGWQPSSHQLGQLVALQQLLRHWNQRVNLTRLVEGGDYWIAQVFDSLWPLLPLLPPSAMAVAASDPDQPAADAPFQVIDVGTGGGFPGLAVAIALPRARLTLVDSVKRKLDAVAAMATELGLAERLTLRCERVERTGRRPECRGRFQLALARAVAAAPVVAEYLVPLLAPNGQALLYRGQWADADGVALQPALAALRAELRRLERRELPGGRGVRHALALRPLQPCPAAYPRAVGVPGRQPLGQTPPPDR
ncbi:MAG: 16S rRNA (guanine(527)-N(7))-methyltransferase RsmG [Cyanobium sp.]|jgi:16S rRNA (guanine527-N7)-methyltransferase|nr:RsmG family class I SAM-dependent methyltransferase [Synechococcaceae cyanobacterium]